MYNKKITNSILGFTFFILIFIIISEISTGNKQRFYNSENLIKSNVLTIDQINKIRSFKNNFILIVGISDCDLCRFLIQELRKQSFNEVYYFDTNLGDNVELQECFRVVGFPTSFVFNDSFEIIGRIEGLKDFILKKDSILNETNDLNELNNHILNSNFKALLALKDQDINKAFRCSNMVPVEFRTTYNNYISYMYYLNTNKSDSVNIYIKKIKNDNEGVNIHVYKRIKNEMELIKEYQ